jgi:hypothetical protein
MRQVEGLRSSSLRRHLKDPAPPRHLSCTTHLEARSRWRWPIAATTLAVPVPSRTQAGEGHLMSSCARKARAS